MFERTQTSLEKSMKYEIQQVTGTGNVTIDTITRTFESIRSIITNHENKLKQQIREIESRNKKLIEDFNTELRGKQKELSKRSIDFEHSVSTNDHTKLLQGHKALTEYLDKIIQELSELQPPILTGYRIEGIDQLQGVVEDIIKRTSITEWKQGNLNCFISDT